MPTREDIERAPQMSIPLDRWAVATSASGEQQVMLIVKKETNEVESFHIKPGVAKVLAEQLLRHALTLEDDGA